MCYVYIYAPLSIIKTLIQIYLLNEYVMDQNSSEEVEMCWRIMELLQVECLSAFPQCALGDAAVVEKDIDILVTKLSYQGLDERR